MEIALKEAKLAKERDEIPVGAVIIDKNKNVYTWFEEILNRSGVSCGCLSKFL